MTDFPAQPRVGTLGEPVSREQPSGKLNIYRLEPNARLDDPRWDNAPNHGVLRVRAFSPADARVVAAEAEIDFLDLDAKPGDGTTTDFASAFRDDKLYHVSLEEEDGGVGPRGLVRDA
ncbi:hypothetical protein SAMN05877838_1399 [Hoeflea halophila]|uniref:Uncharacterized protein n=1 Tax=Hoeflea halophila TaxID=714899 RepID=A0A286I8W4_9HYPH|nr:hypothetical protein SAMN05877838_1399 [Hoeflea halophila]